MVDSAARNAFIKYDMCFGISKNQNHFAANLLRGLKTTVTVGYFFG